MIAHFANEIFLVSAHFHKDIPLENRHSANDILTGTHTAEDWVEPPEAEGLLHRIYVWGPALDVHSPVHDEPASAGARAVGS